jgi:hypothetical protein
VWGGEALANKFASHTGDRNRFEIVTQQRVPISKETSCEA